MTEETNAPDFEIESVKAELTGPDGKDMLKAAFALFCFNMTRAKEHLGSRMKMSACDAQGKQIFAMSARSNEMVIYTNQNRKNKTAATNFTYKLRL